MLVSKSSRTAENYKETAPRKRHIRQFKITATATATGTSLNKRFNEQNNGCARAL